MSNLANRLGSGLANPLMNYITGPIPFGVGVDSADAFEVLALPDSFPVTFRRSASAYSVADTGADWLANYTGATYYVSTTGDDGDTGGIGDPFLTLNAAISAASDLDVISMGSGIYASPSSAITKDLAFVAPSGGVYIGVFNNLSVAVIDPAADTVRWNVDNIGGVQWRGLLRTDGVKVASVAGTAWCADSAMGTAYQGDGIMSIQAGASSANVSLGTAESLPDLVTAGSVLAWNANSTTAVIFSTGSTSYVGPGITIANANTTAVLQCINDSFVVLDGCSIYGGTQCITRHNTGTLIMFDTLVAGAQEDNIDYDNTAIGVEVNVTSCWAGSNAADNTSTCHAASKCLRVGGTYRGGSRTVHDVTDSRSYVFSCSIGDARFNSKTCLLAASIAQASETVEMDYGDITFLDTFEDGGLTNTNFDTDATVINTELGDAWPY